ncbi:MAG: hypothetical protein NT178_05560 [Proteobacteria bacterium]|nr:hypothetical protein [Pseudomonadota bacterium]
MGIIVVIAWMFNLVVVFGGFAVTAFMILFFIYKRKKKTVVHIVITALVLSIPITYYQLAVLAEKLQNESVYRLFAFAKITWRPEMLYVEIISICFCGAAFLFAKNKSYVYFTLSAIAVSGVFSGLWQAIVGLFYATGFFNYYNISMRY